MWAWGTKSVQYRDVAGETAAGPAVYGHAICVASCGMPTRETLDRFVARVEQSAHVEAIREFYAQDASMQENNDPPRVGRDALVAHETSALARAASVQSTMQGRLLEK